MDAEAVELIGNMEARGEAEAKRKTEQQQHAQELRAMQDRLEAAEASTAETAKAAVDEEARRAAEAKEEATKEAQLELLAKEVALQQQAGEADTLRLELKRAQEAAKAAHVAAKACAEEELEQMRERLYEEQRKTRVEAEKNQQHQPTIAQAAPVAPDSAAYTAATAAGPAGMTGSRVAGKSWKKHGAGVGVGGAPAATAGATVTATAAAAAAAAVVMPQVQVPLSSIPIDELPVALKAVALAQRYDPADVSCWTEDHVAVFLTEVGLGSYAEPFREEAIDGDCIWCCNRWLSGAAPEFLRDYEKRSGARASAGGAETAGGGGWRVELQLLTDIVSCWRASLREKEAAEGEDGSSNNGKQTHGGEQRRLSRLELVNYFDVEAWLRMLKMEPATIHAFHAQVPM
jgi:hypothetical protein